MFEVITSEASYLKSLDILVSHFMLDKELLPNPNLPATEGDTIHQQILDRQQYHFLFSGISAIKGVSERYKKFPYAFSLLYCNQKNYRIGIFNFLY